MKNNRFGFCLLAGIAALNLGAARIYWNTQKKDVENFKRKNPGQQFRISPMYTNDGGFISVVEKAEDSHNLKI